MKKFESTPVQQKTALNKAQRGFKFCLYDPNSSADQELVS